MAKVSIFKIDEYGYPRFTNADWMTRAEAIVVQTTFDQQTEILTYGEFKARQDPDSMSEAEVRRKNGHSAPAKRGVVVTGMIPGFTRAEVEEGLRLAGYAPQSDVNSLTAFVIAGDQPGGKVQRAQAMGINVRQWSEFAGVMA